LIHTGIQETNHFAVDQGNFGDVQDSSRRVGFHSVPQIGQILTPEPATDLQGLEIARTNGFDLETHISGSAKVEMLQRDCHLFHLVLLSLAAGWVNNCQQWPSFRLQARRLQWGTNGRTPVSGKYSGVFVVEFVDAKQLDL
jgi:hypothetical protein